MKKFSIFMLVMVMSSLVVAATQDDVVLNRNGILYMSHTEDAPVLLDGSVDSALAWAAPTDTALFGDINGDGIDDVVLARNSAASTAWFAGYSVDTGGGVGALSNATTSTLNWGPTANVLLQQIENVNGDAYDDAITVVASTTGAITFYAGHSNGNLNAASMSALALGSTTLNDIPVLGDVNGDGYTDAGVFRNGTWFMRASNAGGLSATVITAGVFGAAGDVPILGDMNGDGLNDYVLFRNGSWFGRYANPDGTLGATAIPLGSYGTAGDVPMIADIDGDGLGDWGIFRDGFWGFNLSTGGTEILNWGTTGDIPLIGQFDVIPEPATLALLGMGALALVRRKRK